MTYKSIVISSGHGKYIRGAAGSPVPPYLDEVDEARKVVEEIAKDLRQRGVTVTTFHDDTSHDQNTNLNTIVNFHNKQKRQLDVSVHFNAYQQGSKPMGVECLYLTQADLAKQVSAAIAKAGKLIDRGPKKRTDLFVLNNTDEPAILIETAFCDSSADADLYRKNFAAICNSIADVLGGTAGASKPPPEATAPPPVTTVGVLFKATGKCSYFGGPADTTGMTSTEGLAMIQNVQDAPWLFLPEGTPGTENMGLARKLNSYAVSYCACRWDYSKTPKPSLLENVALVTAEKTGRSMLAYPADWGPNEATNRVADLSPWLMRNLGIETDDVVTVEYPAPNQAEEA